MILLQAAMAAGFLLVVLFIVLCIIGIPLFTILIMKAWSKKAEPMTEDSTTLLSTTEKKPYDWGMLLLAIILSAVAVVALFILIVFILSLFITSLD